MSLEFDERKELIASIEKLRGGRVLVCFFNFDRQSIPPGISGLSTQFSSDTKESLFKVLKESDAHGKGIDLCLYTRGGETNGVWPIVNIIRAFDPDFEVLVPFRCHSSGTLVALGAKRIILGPLSELSPIDPTTGNQFNPVDPANPGARLGISVEDVQAFRNFTISQLGLEDLNAREKAAALAPFLDRLIGQVHPIAIGNVHRTLQQIKQLAGKLLDLHPVAGRDNVKVIDALTTGFYSHLHMISADEALKILSGDHVGLASPDVAKAMDELLRAYENRFNLRKPFVLGGFLEDTPQKEARFIGACIESRYWSYLFETRTRLTQHMKIPPNVQVQVPPGQVLPLLPGMPREFNIEVIAQSWMHNKEPIGITV